MKQQLTGLNDDLLDLDHEKQKSIEKFKERSLDHNTFNNLRTNKRLAVNDGGEEPTSVRKVRRRGEGGVPSSVRKHRREKGGVSATMSSATSAISDNLSYDGSSDDD